MKKIAIIGGSGFIGSNLTKRLDKSGYEYKILDIIESKNTNYQYFDVTNNKINRDFKGYDLVINLAAEHRDDVHPISKYDEVNVDGATNTCNFARENNINTIIFTSSVAIYGFAPPGTKEEGMPNYFNDYGRTKYLAEGIYVKWYEENPNERNLIIIRPTAVFGEGNRGNVYNLIKQINGKKFLMFGNGRNVKSLAYVENVSAFIEHMIGYKKGLNIFNYIDKPDLNMNELISLIRYELFNKNNVGLRFPKSLAYLLGYIADFIRLVFRIELPVSSIRIKKFLNSSLFGSSVKDTGFSPPVKIKDALKATIKAEFKDNASK